VPTRPEHRRDQAGAAADTAAEAATPDDKAQRNFTDPDARIMKTSDGSFHYCYTAQTAADDTHQVIVATQLTNRSADCPEFTPLLDEIERNCGARPRQVLADAGYFSEDNVAAATGRDVDALIATGRLKHDETPPAAPRGPIPKNATPKQRMARKLRTKPGRAAYARRKAIIEPVFAQIDTVQGNKQVLERRGRCRRRMGPPRRVSQPPQAVQTHPNRPGRTRLTGPPARATPPTETTTTPGTRLDPRSRTPVALPAPHTATLSITDSRS